MDVPEAKRLNQLEEENAKLKKLLAEQMLDAAALRELLSKNVWSAPSVQALPALFQRLRADVPAVHLHDVIGDEDRFCLAVTGFQRLEIGTAVGAKDNGLAVEHRTIDRQRGDRVSDAGEGVAVVRRGPRPQAHLLAV